MTRLEELLDMKCLTDARALYKDMKPCREKFQLIREYVKYCEEARIAELEEMGYLPEPRPK